MFKDNLLADEIDSMAEEGDTYEDLARDFNTSIEAQISSEGFFYTTMAGDTLFLIAAQFETTVDAILRANPSLDPNPILIGQHIWIQ